VGCFCSAMCHRLPIKSTTRTSIKNTRHELLSVGEEDVKVGLGGRGSNTL
jgi:hypothetical protein